MQFNVLFFSLILACLYLTLAQGSYEDCCLKYVKQLNKGTCRMAMKYRLQLADGGCNIPAVVFTMKKGRVFCADPKQQWVMDLMAKIDNKSKSKHHRRRGPKRG